MFSQSVRAYVRGFAAAAACAAAFIPVAALADDAGSYSCPVLGSKVESITKDTLHSDYKGVRYYFCCGSCKPDFDKNPAKFLKDSKTKGKVVGGSLFDPITTIRIDPKKAVSKSEFNGVRYFFAKADGKDLFDKDSRKYAIAPDKELLFCPISDEVVSSYEKASDYSDVKGTRYYFCCAGCKPKFDKDPGKYLENIDARIKAAQGKESR